SRRPLRLGCPKEIVVDLLRAPISRQEVEINHVFRHRTGHVETGGVLPQVGQVTVGCDPGFTAIFLDPSASYTPGAVPVVDVVVKRRAVRRFGEGADGAIGGTRSHQVEIATDVVEFLPTLEVGKLSIAA